MPEIVQIAQEANRRSMIENRRWVGALILGPAVLAPLDAVQITNSSFDAPPDAVFIAIEDNRPVVGVIGLRNVVFDDCQFQQVGIAGTPASIASFRQGMEEGSHAEPALSDAPIGGGSEAAD
jgi:hypothetical protein